MSFPTGCLAYQTNINFVRPIRIRQNSGATVHARFIWSPTAETVALNGAAVARLPLPGGCEVHWLDSGKKEHVGIIERRESEGEGLWAYRLVNSDGVHVVDEAHLAPLTPSCDDPLCLLRNLLWSSAGFFARRSKFQQMRQMWIAQTQGMPGILGARIRPLPHQLAAVRRVLGEGSPRFLLADEVGLGKTIEAGMVLQALLHRDLKFKVLVIAPGAMSRQWLAELYLRFGAEVFRLLDQGMVEGLGNESAEAYLERCLEWGRVVVSASLLSDRPKWFRLISSMNWDAVVVDEAHRYQRNSSLYPQLKTLCRNSRVVLALSATPSRNDLPGLQDLLNLVNLTADSAPLEQQLAQRRDIWFALHNTRQLLRTTEDEKLSPKELSETLDSLWSFLTDSDQAVAAFLDELRNQAKEDSATRLVSYIQERYRIDHRVVRSRRNWVEKGGEVMARRRLDCKLAAEDFTYRPDEAEKQLARCLAELPDRSTRLQTGMLGAVLERLCLISPSTAVHALNIRKQALHGKTDAPNAESAFRRLFDEPEPVLERAYLETVVKCMPPQQGEREWLQETSNWAVFWQQQSATPARFIAVANRINALWREKLDAAILVFAQDDRIVRELARYLAGIFGEQSVGEFHSGLSQLKLEEVARAFQKGKVQILVSDELGGEGRNFQHAAAVVHIDLPWSPSRLEQRIGRLDRIGRSAENEVLSIVCCGPSELEQAIYRMHREIFCVFEKSIGPIEFRLTGLRNDLSSAVALGANAIEALEPKMRAAIAEAESEDDEIMDAALQLSQDEFEEGKELAESLRKAPWHDWEAAAIGWARELGVICEPQVDGTIRIQIKPDHMQVDVKGVNSLLQAGIYGTFNRKQALKDEKIHLFGPGHPFLNTLEVLVEKSWLGRACIWKRNLGPANGRIYAIFHIVYEPNFAVLANRMHRATAELAVLRHYQPGSAYIALALPNLDHPEYEIVSKDLVKEMLDKSSSLGPLSVVDLSKLGAPDFAYRLMKKVEQAQDIAIAELRRVRQDLITDTNVKFAHDVQTTIEALRDRIDKHDCADAAGEELSCWSAAPDSISSEILRVDGIQIVFTPKKQSGVRS